MPLWFQTKTDWGLHNKKHIPSLSLKSFRVLIRPPRSRDWGAWAAVRRQNKDYLKPFEPAWSHQCLTQEYFMRRLKKQTKDWLEDRAYSFLIFRRNSGQLIGGVNINHICRGAADYGTLGYWLDYDHQGQGYMYESLRLVMAYSFETLKLHRLNAACIPENSRSQSLLLSLGFEEEGYAKSYLQIDGRWQDHILFGLSQDS